MNIIGSSNCLKVRALYWVLLVLSFGLAVCQGQDDIKKLCDTGKYIPPFHPYVCNRTFYVSAATGSDSNDGSQLTPWATLQQANNFGPIAGDCINVEPGVYTQPMNPYFGLELTNGGNANTRAGYVTWISAVPHAAVIKGTPTSSQDYLVGVIGGSYIIFDGFEIDATGMPNTAAFGIDAFFGGTHHIMVINNIIHNAGSAGISAILSDYYTFYGNDVYNNQFTSTVRSSGISVYEPQPATFTPTPEDEKKYHIVISHNIVHYNILTYPCTPDEIAQGINGCPHSDGEGIILDNWSGSQTGRNPYPYSALVEDNLIFANGSAGVSVFEGGAEPGQIVTIRNNRVYNDWLDQLSNIDSTGVAYADRGELQVYGSNNVAMDHNIAYALPVSHNSVLQYNESIFETPQFNPTSSVNENVVWSGNDIHPKVGVAGFQYDDAAARLEAFNNDNSNGDARATCHDPGPYTTAVVNGVCGSANGSFAHDAPSGEHRCAVGQAVGLTGNNPWYWECTGSNGGLDASCSTHSRERDNNR